MSGYNTGSAILIVGSIFAAILNQHLGTSFPDWVLIVTALAGFCTLTYAAFSEERKRIWKSKVRKEELKCQKLELEVEELRRKVR